MIWTVFLSLIFLFSSSITLACGKGKSSRHAHSKTNAHYQARKAAKKAPRRHAKALQRVRELPPKYVKAEKLQELERVPSSEDVVIEF